MHDLPLRYPAALWWAPSFALAVVPALASSWGVDLRLGYARHLVAREWRDAALRLYAAVQTDISADLRRARRGECPMTRLSAVAVQRRRLLALALPAP